MGKIFNLVIDAPKASIGKSIAKHINSEDGVSVENFVTKARSFDGMRIEKLELYIKAELTSQNDVDDLISGLTILKYTFK